MLRTRKMEDEMAAEKQPLTSKQAEILNFIKAQLAANGYPPSRRDIAEKFETHLNNVSKYIDLLVDKGHLEKDNSTRPFTLRVL